MVQIPVDICGIICQDPTLRPGDLSALATVSRSFHSEAERQLYSNVSISDPRFIKSWCLTIARKTYLSPRVKSLKIVFPPSKDWNQALYHSTKHALRACFNLSTLGVHNDGRTPPGHSGQVWIIENHPFKLLHFTNDYFNTSYLNTFYAQNPGIRTLSSPIFHKSFEIPTILPNLTTLDVPANFLVRASGPGWDNHEHLREIQYSLNDRPDEVAALEALGRFEATLTSVSIIRKTNHRMGYQDVIARVVSAAPNVKFLRIVEETPPDLLYVHPQPLDVVSEHLTTVVVKAIMLESFEAASPLHEILYSVESVDTLLLAAPSIQHITVIMDKNYRYSRGVHGEAVYMGEVDVDDSEWMASPESLPAGG